MSSIRSTRCGYALGSDTISASSCLTLRPEPRSPVRVYGAPSNQFGQMREQTGLSLGAGLEWKVTLPILGATTLRGEYIYDSYPTAAFNLAGGPVRVGGSVQTLRLAMISYPGALQKPSEGSDAPTNWGGDYAGVTGGDVWTRARTTLGGATTTTSANGPAFGVFSGHNFMFGSLMLGFEGATELENVRGSGAQPGIAAVSYRDYFDADARGRAGWAIGQFLPYVAIGGDWSRSQQIDAATGSSRNHVPASSLEFGGGLEYMIDDNWSARADYSYDRSYKNQVTGLDATALSQSRSAGTLRIGLAYHFH